jgi:hypothetical protein
VVIYTDEDLISQRNPNGEQWEQLNAAAHNRDARNVKIRSKAGRNKCLGVAHCLNLVPTEDLCGGQSKMCIVTETHPSDIPSAARRQWSD